MGLKTWRDLFAAPGNHTHRPCPLCGRYQNFLMHCTPPEMPAGRRRYFCRINGCLWTVGWTDARVTSYIECHDERFPEGRGEL